MESEPSTESHVEHADHVGTAGVVDSAEHVNLVSQISAVTDSFTTLKGSRLRGIGAIAQAVVVVCALALTWFTIAAHAATETESKEQLRHARDQQICAGRYQDAVDAASTQITIYIGDILVTLAQQPAGPERSAAIAKVVVDIADADKASRAAVNAKAVYNAGDRPLPCPLDQPSP